MHQDPTPDQPDNQENEANDHGESQGLILLWLFDELPLLSASAIEHGLAKFGKPTEPMTVTDLIADGEPPHVTVHFDGHSLLLVGYDEPASDDNIGQSIECSNWTQPEKEPLRRHQAHMFCFYLAGSDDPGEQMIACMRLAGAFLDAGLLGYIDREAWNCMPAPKLREGLHVKARASFRQHVPLGVWTGFVKLFANETDIWFCTKGYHRWGMSDLAFFGQLPQAQEAFDMFADLFFYSLNSGTRIIAGNTAELGNNLLLRFEAANGNEDEEYLNGPLGTLIIKKIIRSEMH